MIRTPAPSPKATGEGMSVPQASPKQTAIQVHRPSQTVALPQLRPLTPPAKDALPVAFSPPPSSGHKGSVTLPNRTPSPKPEPVLFSPPKPTTTTSPLTFGHPPVVAEKGRAIPSQAPPPASKTFPSPVTAASPSPYRQQPELNQLPVRPVEPPLLRRVATVSSL